MTFLVSMALILTTVSTDVDVKTLRNLFSIANVDQTANEKLLKLTASYTLKENPLYYAYNAAAEMSMANHAFWPTTKYDHFTKGKAKLEKAVYYDFQNVEIRFIRYSVQKGAPALVDYNQNMAEDKAYILAHIDESDWSAAYKKEIKAFLNK